MQVIPALDLRAGGVVRLRQGDFERQTSYPGHPLELARAYAGAGAHRLHIVDLDAARGGRSNRDVIIGLLASVDLEVQVAGGIRAADDVEFWLAAGAAAVVMGTTAVRHVDQLQRLATVHPQRILAALDVRGGRPLAEVWLGSVEASLEEIVGAWSEIELAGVILTSVDRDGTLEGPDLKVLERARRLTTLPLTYSGGIADLAHLDQVAGAGADAVILGRSLLEGRLSLAEAAARPWA